MLSGATWSAVAIVGTPVFKIVVSSDSMKNATAISHGNSRLLASASEGCEEGDSIEPGAFIFGGLGCIGHRDRNHVSIQDNKYGVSRKTSECQPGLRGLGNRHRVERGAPPLSAVHLRP